MKNERILNVGPYKVGRDGLKRVVEANSKKDGHVVIASAGSLERIKSLARLGLKPTMAVIQDYSSIDNTAAIAKNVKELFPNVAIVTLALDQKIEEADLQIDILKSGREIVDFLTNLQH